MNKKINILMIFLLLIIPIMTTGFTNIKKNPKTVYRVYLKGKSLGLIKSKKALANYIDQKQEEIKKKYNVDKVYAPTDLDIVKETTYNGDIKTNEEIYSKIENISPFTINGYVVKIKGIDTKDSNGKTIKGKTKSLYILDKEIFTNSVERTVKSFISEEAYDSYKNNTQEEIKDTGKIIKDIHIQNKITLKKDNIPVDKTIYQTEDDLSKYLLFGTTEKQATYEVKTGETIPEISFNNKISTDEFLIANPDLVDENSLLAPGQTVTLGIIKPQFNVVEEDKVVFIEETNYQTETRYDDSKNVGYSEVIQAGVKGKRKVTQEVQKVNGETINTVSTSEEIIKEPITEIIVKGGKKSSYWGGGYGSAVATRGQWGWPATCSNVSSPFGYRWGRLHDAIDISGCGYGSNIFAAQAGTVVQSGYKYDNGEFVTIDHHNGYFTLYAHMVSGSRRVRVGDYVEKGQVLGGMGRTGAATGVHLHFAIWKGYPYRGGRPQNPLAYY